MARWQRSAPVPLGEPFARGTSGRGISSRRGSRQRWQVSTAPLAGAEAVALRGLIEGRGHSWSFDSTLYADGTRLGPSGTHSAAVVATLQRWGAGCAQVGPTSPSWLRYAVGASDEWTLIYWKRPLDFYYGLPTTHDHFIQTSTGLNYRNGSSFTPVTSGGAHDRYVYGTVASGLITLRSVVGVVPAFDVGHSYQIGDLAVVIGGFTGNTYVFSVVGGSGLPGSEPDWDSASSLEDVVSDGNLEWSNYDDDGFTFFDDVAYLPYVAPASWVPQLYAAAQLRAWTSQPDVRADGDLTVTARTARGAVDDGEPREHRRSGAWERGGESLGFTLTEAT